MFDASLSYEVLIYLNSFYYGMFASVEIGMCLFKAINLRYDEYKLAQDTCILILVLSIDAVRIVLGRRGALVDKGWQVITSALLTFPCILGIMYLIFIQVHPLEFEYVLCALMLALHFTEVYFCIAFIFSLCRPVTYD